MMSQAGLDPLNLERSAGLLHDKAFAARSHLEPRRILAVRCPEPMSKAALARLAEHQVWCYKDTEQPDWAKLIARDREGLLDSVIVVQDQEDIADPEYYKVVYAAKPKNCLPGAVSM